MKSQTYCYATACPVYAIGSPKASTLVYCFHGLGQLAGPFLAPFQKLATVADCSLIAPQAPHKYVRDPFSGAEGACWSCPSDTPEVHEATFAYLDAVAAEWEAPNTRVILFGFSQGGLTASRWAAHRKRSPSHLILHSAPLPRKMTEERILAERITLIAGTRDPLVTPQLKEDTLARARRLASEVELCVFEGAHEILTETLENLWTTLKLSSP